MTVHNCVQTVINRWLPEWSLCEAEANQSAGLVSSTWGTCHAVQLGTFMLWISPCKLCSRRLRVAGLHGLKSALNRRTCPLVFGDGDKLCMLWSKDLSAGFPGCSGRKKEISLTTQNICMWIYIFKAFCKRVFLKWQWCFLLSDTVEVYWYFGIGNKDQIRWQGCKHALLPLPRILAGIKSIWNEQCILRQRKELCQYEIQSLPLEYQHITNDPCSGVWGTTIFPCT